MQTMPFLHTGKVQISFSGDDKLQTSRQRTCMKGRKKVFRCSNVSNDMKCNECNAAR